MRVANRKATFNSDPNNKTHILLFKCFYISKSGLQRLLSRLVLAVRKLFPV